MCDGLRVDVFSVEGLGQDLRAMAGVSSHFDLAGSRRSSCSSADAGGIKRTELSTCGRIIVRNDRVHYR